MKQLEETTRELILDKITTLQQQVQAIKETTPKIIKENPHFEQMQFIEVTLVEEQIELLRLMIIKDTAEL